MSGKRRQIHLGDYVVDGNLVKVFAMIDDQAVQATLEKSAGWTRRYEVTSRMTNGNVPAVQLEVGPPRGV